MKNGEFSKFETYRVKFLQIWEGAILYFHDSYPLILHQTLLPRIILLNTTASTVSKLEICSGVSVIMTRTCCLLIIQFHFPIVVWFTVRYTIGNRYTEPFARAPSQHKCYDKQSEDESLINWIFIFTSATSALLGLDLNVTRPRP